MVLKQSLEQYITSLTQADITQSLPETLFDQLTEFNAQYADAFNFPLLNNDNSKSILIQATIHHLSNAKEYTSQLLPGITFLRLLLRDNDTLTGKYILRNMVLDVVMNLYGQVQPTDYESYSEMIKLLINFGHVDQQLRGPLTDYLGKIMQPMENALPVASADIKEQIYFLINRLVFYSTFGKLDALKTWEHNAERIRKFWPIDREISSRNMAEILKLMYNISIHHEGNMEALSDLFHDQVLHFIRITLEQFAALKNYVKAKVDLVATDDDNIKLVLTELDQAQEDHFSKSTTEVVVIKHCCQVLMNIPVDRVEKVLTVDGNGEQLHLEVVYGLLRIFLAYLDQEEDYGTLHTPILVFFIVASTQLPVFRDEMHRGIMYQEWTQRSIDETLVNSLPEEKRNLKRRTSNLEGIPGGLVKENLTRLLTHFMYNFKSTLAQFLYNVCEEDMGEFVSQFGPGNTAGFLADKGLLAGLFGAK